MVSNAWLASTIVIAIADIRRRMASVSRLATTLAQLIPVNDTALAAYLASMIAIATMVITKKARLAFVLPLPVPMDRNL
jgi:hypothetical protein